MSTNNRKTPFIIQSMRTSFSKINLPCTGTQKERMNFKSDAMYDINVMSFYEINYTNARKPI